MSKSAKSMNQVFDVPSFSFGATAVIRHLPSQGNEPLRSSDLSFEKLKQLNESRAKAEAESAEKKPRKG